VRVLAHLARRVVDDDRVAAAVAFGGVRCVLRAFPTARSSNSRFVEPKRNSPRRAPEQVQVAHRVVGLGARLVGLVEIAT
jgi:hypothetical protein